MDVSPLVLARPIDNSLSKDRQALIDVLAARCLKAHPYESGGGLHHVCLYLVEDGSDWLAVATGDAETACDIGLVGERDKGQVGDVFDIHPQTLGAAADAFQSFWNERASWIDMYHAGALDIR